MPHRGRVIVIDDKTEDGEAIVRSLWKLQVPSFFLHYDQDVISSLDSNKKLDGIRYIFQDIALVSPDFPGNDDYSAAAAGIDRILDDNNGPWLLITWSTWGNDPDRGNHYAKQLFEHLSERLPSGKRPYQYVVIDKRPYAEDREHGAVRTDLSTDEKNQLFHDVQGSITPVESLEALAHWEANVRSSASKVLHNLWDMVPPSSPQELNKSLGGVLYQLALAQEGTRLRKNDDLAFPLYQILSNMLYDKVSHIDTDAVKVPEDVKQSVEAGRINSMLHWDSASKKITPSPGCVYEWPSEDVVNLGTICVSQDNIKEFVIDAFIGDNENKKQAATKDQEMMNNVRPILFDITPACDHAQDKAFWRRFLVGIIVYEKAKKHFYSDGGKKIRGDYLKATPKLQNGEDNWYLILNSKLIVSIPDQAEYFSNREQENPTPFIPMASKLKLVGRVREQMLQEFISWYGRMATRPGIVSLN